MTTLIAYHNDPLVKQKYVERFAKHRAADEVIQGQGFDEGRGCFVGCTLDAYDHSHFPKELGWPTWLAHLADTIFEGIPESEAPQFGTDIFEAVPVGANLEPVRSRFLLTIQRRNLARIENATTVGAEACREAVRTIIALLEKDAAGSVASSAARSAWSAAALSAGSVASSAESAACCAGSAARSAARSVESAARSAASMSEEYRTQRDDLLALLREATND